MWKPWEWAGASQAAAVANARRASVELSRRRLEREDVELFLAGQRAPSPRPAELHSGDVPTVGAG
jgi:hypothetical protein